MSIQFKGNKFAFWESAPIRSSYLNDFMCHGRSDINTASEAVSGLSQLPLPEQLFPLLQVSLTSSEKHRNKEK